MVENSKKMKANNSKFKKAKKMENLKIQMNGNILYDEEKYESALKKLNEIGSLTGQHYYNISRCEYRLANEQETLEALHKCVQKDSNMAIGYFQLGVTQYELKQYEGALTNFEQAYEFLRGNASIDYRPLHLAITLYESDIMYNLSLCFLQIDEIEKFKDAVSLAMEQAEDIERHRDIRELERVKDDSVINANKFDLIHVSPFAVYRVSPKIIKSFEANQPIDKGKAKVVGEGGAGFCPVSKEENKRMTNFEGRMDEPMSAKLKATLLKEKERAKKEKMIFDLEEKNSIPFSLTFEVPDGRITDSKGRRGAVLEYSDASPARSAKSQFEAGQSSPAPPRRPPPKRTTQNISGVNLEQFASLPNIERNLPNIERTVSDSRTENIRTISPDPKPKPKPNAKPKKHKKKKDRSVRSTEIGEIEEIIPKEEIAEIEKPEIEHSEKPEIENAENPEVVKSAIRTPDKTESISDFSEGTGEHKLQGNTTKDEKRLEVKIPADSNGLNSSIRLAVNVSLQLELEYNRETDFDTMMLHLRDRLHAIASITNPNSTNPRLYTPQGTAVFDEEDYKELINNVNSVDLILK